MSGPTVKILNARVRAVFRGDYITADDVPQYFGMWLDAGMEDRDDLVSWEVEFDPVVDCGSDPADWPEGVRE